MIEMTGFRVGDRVSTFDYRHGRRLYGVVRGLGSGGYHVLWVQGDSFVFPDNEQYTTWESGGSILLESAGKEETPVYPSSLTEEEQDWILQNLTKYPNISVAALLDTARAAVAATQAKVQEQKVLKNIFYALRAATTNGTIGSSLGILAYIPESDFLAVSTNDGDFRITVQKV